MFPARVSKLNLLQRPTGCSWQTDVEDINPANVCLPTTSRAPAHGVRLTFRRPICFLKSSENSFFRFVLSSSLCPPSLSSCLRTIVQSAAARLHIQKINSNVMGPPASQSRNPSFLPRRDPTGSRTLLWAHCSGLGAWC